MPFSDFRQMLGQMRAAQQQMKQVQQKLAAMRIEASAGGGAVRAVVDGEANLVDLQIDASLLDAEEIQVLPKLIKKAVQEAQKDARRQVLADMKNMLGDLA
ncbi:MAG: YbaB/EbfC family nucleoid-associated protein [Turneriella sp.]|nr:YbaB/EbfC family nucleoid-associated protein [Turneriella sp.]